jgi:hypothetical protein
VNRGGVGGWESERASERAKGGDGGSEGVWGRQEPCGVGNRAGCSRSTDSRSVMICARLDFRQ